jgi:hypothetical protein
MIAEIFFGVIIGMTCKKLQDKTLLLPQHLPGLFA